MSEGIQPFYRTADSEGVRHRRPRFVPLMLLHFAVAGAVSLLAALGLFAYLYTLHFRHIDLGWSLRIANAGDIYEANTQWMVLLGLFFGAVSVAQFQAFRQLSRGTRAALGASRLAALLLLAGFPAALFAWTLELDPPGVSPVTVQTVTRLLAGVLAVQAVVALIYAVFLFLPGARRLAYRDLFSEAGVLDRLRTVGMVLWVVFVVALGTALAVMTGLIELPTDEPAAGELLYASSFEASTDQGEWDIYTGRDSAQIVPASSLGEGEIAAGELSGDVLAITHGSPISDDVVFSALDRTFNDMDLRVTTQQIEGPDDNQYGVIFRYRGRDSYYGFFISGDGYYKLVKREGDTLTDISTWGQSDAIRQGTGANVIRIVAADDTFRFYVNGAPMPLCLRGDNAFSMWSGGECFTAEAQFIYSDADFGQGGVGLAAGSSVDLSAAVVIAFDDVTITGPDGDPVGEGEAGS